MGDAEDLCHLGHALRDLGFGHRDDGRAERECEVVAHGEVGIKRVLLEDHGDVALGRGVVQDRGTADGDVAPVWLIEAGDHAESGGLAGAGGAEEDDEGTVGDRHGDVL